MRYPPFYHLLSQHTIFAVSMSTQTPTFKLSFEKNSKTVLSYLWLIVSILGIVDFDSIVVLHERRIVECDAPHVLPSKAHSRFGKLHEL